MISSADNLEWKSFNDEEINILMRRVTIEAEPGMFYVTETGMKIFAIQVEQLLQEKNK